MCNPSLSPGLGFLFGWEIKIKIETKHIARIWTCARAWNRFLVCFLNHPTTISYLLYFNGSLKTRHRGIPTQLTWYLEPAKILRAARGASPDKLVWWKSENRTYDNKKWCFFLKESGSGVVPYSHESSLPTTWHSKYCFKMTQNTPSFQLLWSPDCIGPDSAGVVSDISYKRRGGPGGTSLLHSWSG